MNQNIVQLTLFIAATASIYSCIQLHMTAKGNGPTNRGLVGIKILSPRPAKSLISDLIVHFHALIVRLCLLVRKNPEESGARSDGAL